MKRVGPWFSSKNRPFSYFFFSKKSKKEIFLVFFNRKECVLDLKSEVLAKSKKNRHFAKGLVHGFSQQIELFFISFFLSQESQKKTFFVILDRKECFLEHKRKVSKKSKKAAF